jgi:hypothetical protein
MKNKKLKGGNERMKNIVKTLVMFSIVVVLAMSIFSQAVLADSSYNGNSKKEYVELSYGENATTSGGNNSTTSDGGSNSSTTYQGGNRPELQKPVEMPRPADYVENTGVTRQISYVKMYIDPEKIVSKDGREKYNLDVKDAHVYAIPACVNDPVAPCMVAMPTYNYKLYFYSQQGLQGSFEQEEFTLGPGEEKIIPLYVQADKKGANVFEVTVVGDEAKASAKGLLVYGDETQPPQQAIYFFGEGYALSEDGSQGRLVDFKILSNEGALQGKMTFGGTYYQIKGTASNADVRFNVMSSQGVDSFEGAFEGKIQKFDEFYLLTGDLTMGKETWKVSAISKKEVVFIDAGNVAVESKPVTETVSEGQIMAVGTSRPIEGTTTAGNEVANKEIYVAPQAVTKEFFGIENPYFGKNILKVEVTDSAGNKAYASVAENDKTKVGNYEVGVGSLAVQGTYDITVKKAA